MKKNLFSLLFFGGTSLQGFQDFRGQRLVRFNMMAHTAHMFRQRTRGSLHVWRKAR